MKGSWKVQNFGYILVGVYWLPNSSQKYCKNIIIRHLVTEWMWYIFMTKMLRNMDKWDTSMRVVFEMLKMNKHMAWMKLPTAHGSHVTPRDALLSCAPSRGGSWWFQRQAAHWNIIPQLWKNWWNFWDANKNQGQLIWVLYGFYCKQCCCCSLHQVILWFSSQPF